MVLTSLVLFEAENSFLKSSQLIDIQLQKQNYCKAHQIMPEKDDFKKMSLPVSVQIAEFSNFYWTSNTSLIL